GFHAAGARPDALSPTSSPPVHRIAKRSEPRPLLHGSTTVGGIAVASAASPALPPLASIAMPACVASGCDVATTLRANTGCRRDGYGSLPFEREVWGAPRFSGRRTIF